MGSKLFQPENKSEYTEQRVVASTDHAAGSLPGQRLTLCPDIPIPFSLSLDRTLWILLRAWRAIQSCSPCDTWLARVDAFSRSQTKCTFTQRTSHPPKVTLLAVLTPPPTFKAPAHLILPFPFPTLSRNLGHFPTPIPAPAAVRGVEMALLLACNGLHTISLSMENSHNEK